MNKFILSLLVLSVFSLNLISALQTITIDDTSYKSSILYPSILYGTGSQIIANITVTNDQGWNYIKRVNLNWDSSNVGCNEKSYADDWKKYQCILTVIPTMNQPTDVYITSTDYDGDYSILWNNFNFSGQVFPVYPSNIYQQQIRNCTMITSCSKYEKVCHYEQTCRRFNKQGDCTMYSKKKICEYTSNCLNERTKRVCMKNP